MRNGLRLFLPIAAALLFLVLSPAALGDETAYQFIVPPTGGTGCSGLPHETIDGTVTGCTPNSSGVGPFGFFSVAADGSAVFQADGGSIWLVHPDGSSIELDNSTLDSSPTISYDGSKVVFARYDPADSSPQSDPSVNVADIYSINSDGTGLQLIASGQGTQYLRLPSISPDGSTVAYWCGPGINGDLTSQGCGPLTDGSYRNSGVMRINIDGSNRRMIVIGPGDNLQPVGPSRFSWSPDSQWLAMDGIQTVLIGGNSSTTQNQLFEYRTDGSDLFNNLDPTRQVTHFTYDPLAPVPHTPIFPRFSPDGSQLLYMDPAVGTAIVGVDGSNTHQVSLNDGGFQYDEFIPTASPVAPPALVDMTHITVPSVVGLPSGSGNGGGARRAAPQPQTGATAASTLASVNLTVGTVSHTYSATVPQGAVVSQSPTAGAVAHRTVKVGPPVDLVVSDGPLPATMSLNVARTGAGSGTVSSSPNGISCGSTCSHAFTTGGSVTLTATPSSGSTFVGWSGACSGTGACKVTMSQARAVTASFGLVPETLTVKKAGAGSGVVRSVASGIACGATCSHAFGYGASVVLTATPSAGSRFLGWSGACSGAGVCNVTMSAAKSVTATFALGKTLKVTKAGTGSGTVASKPLGISCGASCSYAFAPSTKVVLTATPAAGSTFTGWSGACTGRSVCKVTMTVAKSVKATFAKLGAARKPNR